MVDMAYQVFVDLDATALEGGSIYLGQPDADPETSPIPVYWDEAQTIAASQPLRTSGGVIVRDGTPSDVFSSAAAYSIRVRNRAGSVVWYKSTTGGTSVSRLTFPIPTGPAGADSLIPGPANSTYTSLALLKAAPASNKSYTLVTSAGRTEYAYVTGDFTGRADDVNVVKLDAVPLATGALVRQAATSVNFDGRSTDDKLRETVSVTDARFADGALGDGKEANAARNTAAFKAALAYLAPIGGVLHIPAGKYYVQEDGTQGYCIKSTGPVSLSGDGANTTVIAPASTVRDACDTIMIEPIAAISCQYIGISDLFIGNDATGSRRGRHGVYIRTVTPGQNLLGFNMQRCFIARSTAAVPGYGFKHDNDISVHVNGCMYGANFTENTILGGMHLNGSGDSIRIIRNVLSGPNVGVRAQLVYSQGPASLLSIIDNNITNWGGALAIDSGPRTHILRNNIEHYVAGALAENSGYVVNLRGGSARLSSLVFAQNLIGIYGTSDSTALLSVGNLDGGTIEYNTFQPGLAGVTAIYIEPIGSPRGTNFGPNTYTASLSDTQRIDSPNNGNGLMGVPRTPALQNGWVAYNAAYADPVLQKSVDGLVDINFMIKSGTTTQVCVLGEGYRPDKIQHFQTRALSADGYANIDWMVEPNGIVSLSTAASNNLVTLRGRFRASRGADNAI